MIAISRKTVFAVASIGAMALGTVLTSGAATAAETKIVELTQVACQFVESENGIDRAFATTRGCFYSPPRRVETPSGR